MSLVAYKYMPSGMSETELEGTFAARGHTVDYLVKMMRDQTQSGTLSSFVITGPRGAGKSTVLRMVALRLKQEPVLNAAWLPVFFPEEQFDITSLRELLAAILRELSSQDAPSARLWLDRVEGEPNDEQSEQLAVTGLRMITRALKRRLVLFVENLNLLLEKGFTDQEKGALRRLLMTDPFMTVLGSAVHVFDSLRSYDEAFFNYFGEVSLNRLSAEQVFELLTLRAKYDGNEQFLRAFPQNQAKIRAIAHFSDGNPRLILMLYELLSQGQVTNVVQQLRRLVDELTPLLRHEMERLPPQQRKIVHALMELGGTAQPADLVAPTRLKLNTITEQLRRLKQAQILVLLGGGKGRSAFYTVPDQLFCLWYRMRYLGQNHRRIELFVEVLRTWFEAEDRFETIRRFQAGPPGASPVALREVAITADYAAAPAVRTSYARPARQMALRRRENGKAAPSDWEDVLRMERADATEGIIEAGRLFELHWLAGRREEAKRAIEPFKQRLGAGSDSAAAENIVRLLCMLAMPALREAWPQAWRLLANEQPPGVRETLEFLEPVTEVLEGADASILNGLSPEHREFTHWILARFVADAANYAGSPPALSPSPKPLKLVS